MPRIKLDADFRAATDCPPVHDDLPLIRVLPPAFPLTDRLRRGLRAAYSREQTHRGIHARARLLAGENPGRWGALLDPAEFKALQEEARISFAPGAPAAAAPRMPRSL